MMPLCRRCTTGARPWRNPGIIRRRAQRNANPEQSVGVASGSVATRAATINSLEKYGLVPYKDCMPTPALKISNLRKVYRRGTVAVEELSLTIEEGEFFGFLGP